MLVKILLLFFVFSFLFRTDLSFDQDLGRHTKLGEIILNTHSVPKINLFSYTYPDFPFINTHWLFGVLTYLGSISIGFQNMLYLKVILFLLSVWLTLKIIPSKNQALLLPIGFIFLHVLRERLELRPEIFSFLFTALTLYLLERKKYLFFLPLIQLIWINTHIYFFIGFLLQGIFIIHLLFERIRSHSSSGELKILFLIFTLSAIVSLLNPNGLQGLLYPLNVNQNYGYTIVENQTIFLLESLDFRDPNFLFVKLAIAIVGISIIVAIARSLRKQGSIQIKYLLLALSGVGLALLNVRSFPYLIFLSLPAVLFNFGGIKVSALTKLLTYITVPILLLESFFYFNGDYYKYTYNNHQVGLKMEESIKGGTDFLLKNNLPNPIFNNFDIGSYIIYKGHPKYPVFVDGRPEGYPKEFFTDIYIPTQYDFNKFKELELKMGFNTIIFSITDQTPWGKEFLRNIVTHPGWNTVYLDDFIIILVREEFLKDKNLTALDLSTLSPENYYFKYQISYLRVGFFLLSTGNIDAGNKFLQKGNIIPSDNFFW